MPTPRPRRLRFLAIACCALAYEVAAPFRVPAQSPDFAAPPPLVGHAGGNLAGPSEYVASHPGLASPGPANPNSSGLVPVDTVPFDTVPLSAVPLSAVPFGSVPFDSVPFAAGPPAPGQFDPARSGVDPPAVQSLVPAEFAAQPGSTSTAFPPPPAPEPAPQPIEVGKDRSLTARWDNGFVAESADKSFRLHLGGRLDFDNTWSTEDDNILIGPSPDQTVHDGTLFRRARFRADGRLWEFTDFACEVNFANIQDVGNVDNGLVQVGSVGITDFFLTFREVPLLGNLRVGHLQAPISLERYTGSLVWYYMERSSMFDAFYNPNDYQNGICTFDSYLDDRVTLAGSAAWIGRSDVQAFGFGANEGKYAFGTRATALPIYRDEGHTLLHLGAGFFHQTLVDHRFNVASRPLLRAGAGGNDTPNLIFSGTFFSPDPAGVANVEAAFVRGPFSISSEYAVASVGDVFEQSTPVFAGSRGSATYQGGYVESGLFITPGDHRRYDVKTGTWARTLPVENAYLTRRRSGGIRTLGAVQLLARYTYVDLVDGEPVITPTSGGARAGRQHDVTLGVTWYINSQLWVMINGVATHIDSVVPGADGNVRGIGCRLHFDF
jgi:phosphate-selective porin OprO/OprP